MSAFIHHELLLLLRTIAVGAVLLLCYDLLAAFRNVFAHSDKAVGTEDILYWLCCAFFVFSGKKGGAADGVRIRKIRKISKKRTGLQIRQMMTDRGITVAQLQDWLEIDSPQAVYKWLHGVNLPSVTHLHGLSQILGVTIEEILAVEEEEDDE